MDKLWYPVAASILIVGCGGDVDTGSPAATGGQVSVYYGVSVFTGGSAGIDTGYPTDSGGLVAIEYGPVQATGGSSSTSGGANSFGGAAATGGVTSAIDAGPCLADSDCVQCVYVTAPSTSGECANATVCCGGKLLSQATCAANQAAWEANCSGQGYQLPVCTCIL